MQLSRFKEMLLIYGFVKYDSSLFIPTDVILYCLLWYTSKESWDINNTSNLIKVCNNGLNITRTSNWNGYHYNAFGSDIINYGQKKLWKIKIITTPPKYVSCIQVGIIQTNRIANNIKGSFCQMACHNGYGVYAKNGRLFHGSYYPHSNKYIRIPSFTIDSILLMTLDMKSNINGAELRYAVQNANKETSDEIIGWSDIDLSKSWNLAVALYSFNDAVMLVD